MSAPPAPPAPPAPDSPATPVPASGVSPPPLVIKKSRPSRLAVLRARIRARLSHSSHVFLLGLLVACGIEVVVDWNSTLFEINVLRDGMRQRGLNYSRILANAAVDPMLSFDPEALDRLCEGLFHDEDVVFVRFTDQQGTVMLDRLRDKYGARFAKRRKLPFADYYASQMRRDIGGILADPEMLAQRMASSRHRDFVQAWNDLIERLERRLGQAAGDGTHGDRSQPLAVGQCHCRADDVGAGQRCRARRAAGSGHGPTFPRSRVAPIDGLTR